MSIRTPESAPLRDASVHSLDRPFTFECGAVLPEIRIAYETWGELGPAGDNAVLVVHALTGDAHAASGGSSGDPRPGWWEGLIGPGRSIDTSEYFVVCANLMGSCYGSSGPSDPDPATGEPYGSNFPAVTPRDMARAQRVLLDHLGVKSLALVLGGSLGAMVVWEFIAEYPGLARAAAPIAGAPRTSPWAVAFNSVARQAIEQDPGWKGGRYSDAGPVGGLSLARQIAMITYRTGELFESRFGREREDASPSGAWEAGNRFQVERYLDHQGRKLVSRFDARNYLALTRAMDLHDLSRARGTLPAALSRIDSRVHCVGIDTDVLFRAEEMRRAADDLVALGRTARYEEVVSPYGHDAFLVEVDQVWAIVRDALKPRSPDGSSEEACKP
jgi:homoserine O-acetyltransferase